MLPADSWVLVGGLMVHLVENVAGFTGESAERLVAARNRTFPLAAIEPTTADYLELQSFALPDETTGMSSPR